MDWTRVVTDPVGLSGFALALGFGVLSRLLAAQARRISARWVTAGAFGLALICVIGGLTLAYQRQSSATATAHQAATPSQPQPDVSMSIGKIEQRVESGSAVAGVRGDVIVSSSRTGVK
ncbi:MAG: hypothetical protein ABW318_16510 [Vicinamibacterales bacterium]